MNEPKVRSGFGQPRCTAPYKKLLDEELISETEIADRPGPDLDDARWRYYRLTQFGHAVLSAELSRLRELVNFVEARVRKAEA